MALKRNSSRRWKDRRTLKAVAFTARNEVRFTELPDPTPVASEVLLQVKASGICHTDYEVLSGNYGTGALPLVPGHEFAGVVQAIGPDVEDLQCGDRVVVDPNCECGDCRACQRDWAHLCEKLSSYGISKHGGFAEFSIVNRANLHPLGEMSFSCGALAEPMGCVLNGIDAVRTNWMTDALIFGAGPMGLMMGMALRAFGLKNIAICEILEHRLDLAEKFGFDAIANGSRALEAWHHRADLVVEASGALEVAANVTRYIASGGSGLFFGVCPPHACIKLSPFEMFRRQLTLAGAHSLNHNIPRSLEMIASIGPPIEELVSHRLPLTEIKRLLATKAPQDSLKVQWIPD